MPNAPQPSASDYLRSLWDAISYGPSNSPAATLGSAAYRYLSHATPQSVAADVSNAAHRTADWARHEGQALRAAPVAEGLRLAKSAVVDPLVEPFHVIQNAAQQRAAGNTAGAQRMAAMAPLAVLGALNPEFGGGAAGKLAVRAAEGEGARLAEQGAVKAAEQGAVKAAEQGTARKTLQVTPRRVTPAKVAFDPRIESRAGEAPKVAEMSVELAPHQTQEPTPLSIFDMEGKPFITSMLDKSAAGDTITGINDVSLKEPVNRMGGQDYMFNNPGSVWASDLAPAGRHLELARNLKAETGQNPLYLPWSMGPTAVDFAHMPRELMLKYAQANMGKGAQRELAANIRGIVPEFRSLDDPASIESFREATGAQRSALNRLLDQYRDKGGLGMGAARLATTDLEQLNQPLTSLRNVGVIDANAPLAPSTHPSYRTSIPGEGIGRLKEPVGALELLPDLMASSNLTDPFGFPVGVVPGVKSPLRALQMAPKGGVITEDMLRAIDERLNGPKDLAVPFSAPEFTAHATSERVPYAHANHVSGLLSADEGTRAAYSADPRASWTDENGNDIIYSALGVRQKPTLPATGVYTPPGGVLETNPATIAKPVIERAGSDVAPASRDLLDLAEGLRAYTDAQGAGAWHHTIFNAENPEELGSLFVPQSGASSVDRLMALKALGEKHGLPDVVDTGEGVTMANFYPGPPTGSATREALHGGLGEDIANLTGAMPGRTKIASGYLPMFENSTVPGSGAATQELADLLARHPESVIDQLDRSSALRARYQSGADLDAQMAAQGLGETRPDVQLARNILADKGLRGLLEAHKAGVALPAIAALAAVPALAPRQDAGSTY
jgi:hypothetical protein